MSETVRRHVKVDDGVQTQVELLPILPAERMAALLAAELEQQGFECDEERARRVEQDGTEITVDLRQGTVTVRLAAVADLELERQRSGSVYDPKQTAGTEAQLREKLRQELEQQVEAQQEELREQVTQQLERKLRDIQKTIDGAVNRSSGAALKEKAAQMGEIEEISEDTETGSLTIRVRV